MHFLRDLIVNFFQQLPWPPELVITVLSMLPITEYRAAIPVAMTVYHMSIWQAFFWGTLGSVLVIWPLLLMLHYLIHLFRKIRWIDRFFVWLYAHTKKRHSERFEKYGLVALFLIALFPLPGGGAWSGALVAEVFEIQHRHALPVIALGVTIAGLFVTLLSAGLIS